MITDNDFIFQKESPMKFIQDNFTKKTLLYLNAAIRQGYNLTQELIDRNKLLQDYRGNVLTPRIKSIASEYMVIEYIKNGRLPIKYRLDYNEERNHTFLIFHDEAESWHFTINQSPNSNKPSPRAKYKQRKYSRFESYFNFDTGDLVTEQPVYLELNHGYQTDVPSFVVLGMPKNAKDWYACEILQEGIYLLEDDSPQMNTVEKTLEEFSLDDFTEFMARNEGN